MRIRRLTEADADAYRSFFLEGIRHDPWAFLVSPAEAEAHPARATRERLASGWAFGAFAGADLVGIIAGRPLPMARQAHRMSVGPVYVAEAARGQGAARALLVALTEAARAAGVLQLELEVHDGNAPAIALYRTAGFVEVGRMPRAVRAGTGFEDDLTMVLFLDR